MGEENEMSLLKQNSGKTLYNLRVFLKHFYIPTNIQLKIHWNQLQSVPSLLFSIYSTFIIDINKVNQGTLAVIMVLKFFIRILGRVWDTRHGYRVILVCNGADIGTTNLAKIGYGYPRVTRFATPTHVTMENTTYKKLLNLF